MERKHLSAYYIQGNVYFYSAEMKLKFLISDLLFIPQDYPVATLTLVSSRDFWAKNCQRIAFLLFPQHYYTELGYALTFSECLKNVRPRRLNVTEIEKGWIGHISPFVSYIKVWVRAHACMCVLCVWVWEREIDWDWLIVEVER